jgi:hypothetical protein
MTDDAQGPYRKPAKTFDALNGLRTGKEAVLAAFANAETIPPLSAAAVSVEDPITP